MDTQVQNKIKKVMAQLESDAPGITEGLGALVGSVLGGGASLFAFSSLGLTGLSAAGITSGLAAAGGGLAAVTGGALSAMTAGIFTLAAPIALLGIGGYALAHSNRKAKTLSALNVAIEKLYTIQERLMQNAQHYQEELGGLKALLELLKAKKEKI